MTTSRPTNQDPVAWATWNQTVSLLNRQMLCPQLAPREMPGCVRDLLSAIRSAAGELSGGGERENRISEQLYSALAVFSQETGT